MENYRSIVFGIGNNEWLFLEISFISRFGRPVHKSHENENDSTNDRESNQYFKATNNESHCDSSVMTGDVRFTTITTTYAIVSCNSIANHR